MSTSGYGWNENAGALLTAVVAVVAATALLTGAFAGAAAAHDDGDGLTVHNSTKPLDQHGEVHHITIDQATADQSFYVDVHAPGDRTVNTTNTYSAGTELTDLELELDPTIREDTTLTVATHAANGTELAAEELHLDTVAAPSVSFDAQTHELDQHMEVHHITVDAVAANQPYYVDVHNTSDVTVNTTNTLPAGTALTDLDLELDPTLRSSENLTVAVHAENGTELAAETARVTVADVVFESQTHTEDQHDEVHSIDLESATAGQEFYVDVHNTSGVTVNTTDTFAAGTDLENLPLELSPPLKQTENLTVAVHAADGTELAAQTGRVNVQADDGGTTTDESSDDETTAPSTSDADGSTTTDDSAGETTSGSGPGFGVVLAIVGLVGALLLGRAH